MDGLSDTQVNNLVSYANSKRKQESLADQYATRAGARFTTGDLSLIEDMSLSPFEAALRSGRNMSEIVRARQVRQLPDTPALSSLSAEHIMRLVRDTRPTPREWHQVSLLHAVNAKLRYTVETLDIILDPSKTVFEAALETGRTYNSVRDIRLRYDVPTGLTNDEQLLTLDQREQLQVRGERLDLRALAVKWDVPYDLVRRVRRRSHSRYPGLDQGYLPDARLDELEYSDAVEKAFQALYGGKNSDNQ